MLYPPMNPLAALSPLRAMLPSQQRDADRALRNWLALPFDMARAQYANAVRGGLIRASMLASRDFEQLVGSMERLTLGPLARRV
ncbi:MAG: hypothetical protein RLZZ592_1952 [Pseudomonadota bacterium]|nr:hypothetical protein [Pseudomonadota bacterium]